MSVRSNQTADCSRLDVFRRCRARLGLSISFLFFAALGFGESTFADLFGFAAFAAGEKSVASADDAASADASTDDDASESRIVSGKVADVAGAPLANVAVSDGLNVVKTGADGVYALPARDGARFVFVSTPAGFKVVRGKFYRPLADATDFDFVLEPFAPSGEKTVRFIQVSDVEQYGGETAWLQKICDYQKANDCAFLVSTGDLCYKKGHLFNAENTTEAQTGFPTYFTLGNHDLVDGAYGEANYESYFGPTWYSFDAGPAHFVVTPMPAGDYKPSYSTANVVAWLKNDLKEIPSGKPVVIFQHTAPFNGKFDDPRSLKYGDLDLTSFNLKGWFFGHYHTSVFYKEPKSGVTFGSCAPPNKGGIDHSVSSFYVFELDENGDVSIKKEPSYWNGTRLESVVSESKSATFLKEKWSADAGGEIHFGAPLPIGESDVVVATADDCARKNCAVFRFDGNGKIVWKTPVSNSIKCSLTTDGKRIYASDQGWSVYALDAESGKIVWRDDRGAEADSAMNAPLLKDGVLYAGQGADLVARKAETGEKIWINEAWSGGEGTTASLALVDGLLLVSANWKALYAHRPETGELVWTAKDDALRFRSSAPIPFRDENGSEVVLAASHTTLQTLNPKTGETLKAVKIGRNLQTASVPLVWDGAILVGSADAGLCAFDPTTFERLWNVPTGENLVYSSPYTKPSSQTVEATPVRVGKYVVYGGLDGVLYVVDPAAKKDAKVVQTLDFGAPILATVGVAADGKTLYVADYSGRVVAFDVANVAENVRSND